MISCVVLQSFNFFNFTKMSSSLRLSTRDSTQRWGFLDLKRALISPGRMRMMLAIGISVIIILIWPFLRPNTEPAASFSAPVTSAVRVTAGTATFTPTTFSTPTAQETETIQLLATIPESTTVPSPDENLIILSIQEAGYHRLFAYQPNSLQLTRLTNGTWDDINPSISPDQSQVAFSSNRDGHWNLYLLSLDNGEITKLTDSPGYKAAPSWSPDGNFLVYEAYVETNLRLVILDASGSQPPIILRNQSEADFSPAWSPHGREIAFTSIVGGKRGIWIADLDKTSQERFTKLIDHPSASFDYPAWCPQGTQIAFSRIENGVQNIFVWEIGGHTRYIGSGNHPVWSPDGNNILTTLTNPFQTMLTAYSSEDSLLTIPPLLLPGSISGLTWGNTNLPSPLPTEIELVAQLTPTSLWQPAQNTNDNPTLVNLDNVNAPYPRLHDMVDESFSGLRQRIASAAGWDMLANLENAYVPLNSPLPPGLGNDWLYTGRAFAISPLPINAGWMVITREEYGSEVYWRIYLRTRDQDGSQGKPLKEYPWDFYLRNQGDMDSYEQGGGYLMTIPEGYWVDFTALAAAFGWERLPALPTWRASFPTARFNQFVLTNDQDWHSAMLELYPPEALITPTLFVPPTLTPSPTPRWYRTPTPSSP
jgi:TolB protein